MGRWSEGTARRGGGREGGSWSGMVTCGGGCRRPAGVKGAGHSHGVKPRRDGNHGDGRDGAVWSPRDSAGSCHNVFAPKCRLRRMRGSCSVGGSRAGLLGANN